MRVYLPLAFKHIRVARRPVGLVVGTDRLYIESIGIRVYADALELPVYHSCNHPPKLRIFIDIPQIRPHLGTGVPEPHRRYISGIYECIGMTVIVLCRMHGRIQCIRITVCEHPPQTRVLEHSGHSSNLCLHRRRSEKPLGWSWTLVLVFLRFIGTVPHLRVWSHLKHEFSAGGYILMSDISLDICLSVQGNALYISVPVAVVLCPYGEHSARHLYLHLVEERTAEPVTSRCRLRLINAHRRKDIP